MIKINKTMDSEYARPHHLTSLQKRCSDYNWTFEMNTSQLTNGNYKTTITITWPQGKEKWSCFHTSKTKELSEMNAGYKAYEYTTFY